MVPMNGKCTGASEFETEAAPDRGGPKAGKRNGKNGPAYTFKMVATPETTS
jgi:hypothetical protein